MKQPIHSHLDTLKTVARSIDMRLFLVILITLVIFLSTAALRFTKAAAPAPTPTLIPTPRPVEAEISAIPTPTPFPADYLNNEEQTIGPTVAASLLVLVVTVGVFSHFLRKSTP